MQNLGNKISEKLKKLVGSATEGVVVSWIGFFICTLSKWALLRVETLSPVQGHNSQKVIEDMADLIKGNMEYENLMIRTTEILKLENIRETLKEYWKMQKIEKNGLW